MKQSIRWAIIGCGNVTEKKSGPTFSKVEGSSLMAVMRRNKEKAQDYALRHHVPTFFTDGDEVFKQTDIDAIYIATPPDTHAYYALRALEAGKAVYVEKPMARNYAECVEMINLAESKRLPLYVAYYRRALPYFLKIKELLEHESIGNVHSVFLKLYKQHQAGSELAWRLTPERSGGGYFVDLASHQLDVLSWFFGEVQSVRAVAVNQSNLYAAEDTVFASLQYESGTSFSGSWVFNAGRNNRCDEVMMIGDKGRISFSFFSFKPVRLERNGKVKHFGFLAPEHIQMPFISQMNKELLQKPWAEIRTNMHEAAKVTQLMEHILRLYYLNCQSDASL